jgi:hypothetical protein
MSLVYGRKIVKIGIHCFAAFIIVNTTITCVVATLGTGEERRVKWAQPVSEHTREIYA